MKINEIYHDPIHALLEGEDTDKVQSNNFYDEGSPVWIRYKDGDTVKNGMVILCPRCKGKGVNTSRTLNSLRHNQFISKDRADKFAGPCHVNRKDWRCVGGLMQDKRSGRIIWPEDAPKPEKRKMDKPRIEGDSVPKEEFMSSPEYKDQYMFLVRKYEMNKNADPNSFSYKKYVGIMDEINDTGEVSAETMNYLSLAVEKEKDKFKKSLNPNNKYKDNSPKNRDLSKKGELRDNRTRPDHNNRSILKR